MQTDENKYSRRVLGMLEVLDIVYLRLVLMFGFCFAAEHVFARETVLIDDVTWYYETYSDGTARIVSGPLDYSGSVIVPSRVNGHRVIELDSCFQGCKELVSVTIPDGVSYVGWYGFTWCNNLAHISFPASMIQIGEYAFAGCSSLMSIEVSPQNHNYKAVENHLLTKDGARLIRGPSVVHDVIPDGVKEIGANAFCDCNELVSVEIPFGVQNVQSSAFSGCDKLASLSCPCSVTNIGSSAFYHCKSIKEVVIPESVLLIGDGAFCDCYSLKYMWGLRGVTKIEGTAFRDCTSLTSIMIPKNVESVGDAAFWGCSNLKVIYVNRGDAERVRKMVDTGGIKVDKISFVEIENILPSVVDDDPVISGSLESGFVIKTNAQFVEMVLPPILDPNRVTLEVTTDVVELKPHGVKVKVLSKNIDITPYIDIPNPDASGRVDFSLAKVRDSVIREVLDPAMGAKFLFCNGVPSITTAKTRIGLKYILREGESLTTMHEGDVKVGDGCAWMPSISVIDGDSGFYSVEVDFK